MSKRNNSNHNFWQIVGIVLKYFSVFLLLVFVLSPILWIFISSLKPPSELLQANPTFVPKSPTIENYIELFRVSQFQRYFLNSVIVAGGSSILVVILSTLGAYSVYRCKYYGRYFFFNMIIAIYIFPRILLLLTLYPLFARIGLIDNLASLVIAYVGLTAPLNVWIIRSFFTSIPQVLEDAALIDGANRFQVLYKIFIPLAAPGIGAIAINSFMMTWTEYLFASVLLISDKHKTVPVGMAQFLQQYNIDWELLTAGGILITLPPVIAFTLAGRYFIKGLTAGAVKE